MWKIQYKIRYFWRQILIFFNICPDCKRDLDTMPTGRKHCGNRVMIKR